VNDTSATTSALALAPEILCGIKCSKNSFALDNVRKQHGGSVEYMLSPWSAKDD
jgi:hypothetical protein